MLNSTVRTFPQRNHTAPCCAFQPTFARVIGDIVGAIQYSMSPSLSRLLSDNAAISSGELSARLHDASVDADNFMANIMSTCQQPSQLSDERHPDIDIPPFDFKSPPEHHQRLDLV
jgi:hypothetical protein